MASACEARTFSFVELDFLAVCLAVCSRQRGGFLRQSRPCPFPQSWEFLVIATEPFVMNAHGLNSFVLYFCSLWRAGGDPAPTYAPPSSPPPAPGMLWPLSAHSLQTQAACFGCVMTKDHCFHALQMHICSV